MNPRRIVLLAVFLFAAATLCGCAAMSVKPWDRDLLAQPRMAFHPSPMLHAVDQHIYFSREASMGGDDVGGGGCGCN